MNINITKAWKDAQYRETLTSEELAQLPQNPIGALELTDADLSTVTGAFGSHSQCYSNCDPGNQYGGGYQFGGHHHHRHHHHHGGGYQQCGGNWFGGSQHSSGGSNWFGGQQGGCN
ncbi:mersacidin/lichenicidin family type 2 lantibiotic [Dictyobacter kobayashii]|uniref:Mersacidin/lichenicidin family type 2 lantibiotic n=1 Tax=Dictyobacter kobayashii TaxID=2014872 RepID=A0A402ATC0_9CHLR|nr:mersacidin/lichenicidin family type 2 lantibiotic [Dictyobacter kobayashii]GCE22331.1 hypothetical protein KDK_61310 [Dictyobacter kobayashii]